LDSFNPMATPSGIAILAVVAVKNCFILKYLPKIRVLFRTLIDSTPGVVAAWKTWADKYNLGDSAEIAHNAHGRRLQDTLKDYCNITDEQRLSVSGPIVS
jgi:hypothetical protein